MSAPAPASWHWRSLLGCVLLMIWSAVHAQLAVPAPELAAPAQAPTAVPSDFLENAGKQVKARWRQLYRQPPPTPSSDRLHVAFTLGALVADNYLALQAGDAQQFRNNSQDLLNYCRVLGLAEKVTPDVMAGSKMAETEDWDALRTRMLQTQQHIEALLVEQRDEDLAILLNLGMWFRLFDITTSLVVAEPEFKEKTLCLGSVALLDEAVVRFGRLSEATRANESIVLIGGALDMLQRHWSSKAGSPNQELVELTRDKLKFIIAKLTEK